MPRISCEVDSCFYNSDGGCRLSFVKVDGEEATVPVETECDSFTRQMDGEFNSAVSSHHACDCSDVDCSAYDCRYNDGHICTADTIHVKGCPNCEDEEETCCDTFEF